MPDAVTETFAILACLFFIVAIAGISEISTSLLGCLVWWKECVNIHASASLSRIRNYTAAFLIPAFITIFSRYFNYPSFPPFSNWPDSVWILMVFSAYITVRWICGTVFRMRKTKKDNFKCGTQCTRNFFVIMVLTISLTHVISVTTGIPDSITKEILKWEIIVTYAINLLRKTQIFVYYDGYFAGFLYLCTLEILPTGLLIAPLLTN